MINKALATEVPSISTPHAFALHLWAFVLPLITLAFWLTGPHAWWSSLLWSTPIWVLVYLDNHAPGDERQPREDMPRGPFRLQVFALVAIQLANYVLLGVATSKLSLATREDLWQTVAMFLPVVLLGGVTAGYSGIVLAHELVHRRNPIEFFLGRLLLMNVFYEHFATEHIRGHHPRIGTYEDPATARFGETHPQFLVRTVPAQFKSAWKLESVRVGNPLSRVLSASWLRHRVLQGVVAQVAILAAYYLFFGPIAAFFFVVQAITAVLLLETVNYMEHWGLTRSSKKVVSVDSWDTENYFTLYTLIGLSRHADHHAQASRPFEKLRYFPETAKMPAGYYGTVLMAMFNNTRYMRLATEELQRKALGPFSGGDATKAAQPQSHVHPLLAGI